MLKTLVIAALAAAPLAASAQQQALAATASARAGINTSEYGEEQELVAEDFSKFSTGSESAPDFSANINTEYADSKVPYFENVSQEYTSLPRWGASGAYPAGGAVCLYSTDVYDPAHINTPFFDASKNGGVFIIKFRARLDSPVTDYTGLGLHVIDFSNNPENGSYRVMTTIKGVTDKWQDFELMVYGGTNRMIVNFREEDQNKLFLDDIRVIQIDQYVGTPNVLHHQAYNGTSFRPNWNKVEGAESYIVNVYNADENGNIGTPVVENMQTTDTICTVRGILPNNIYRYNVTAVGGGHRSLPSANIELYDLVTPPLENVENVDDGAYRAKWDNVARALFYNYYVYEESPAQEDGELTLIDEDFSGVTDWGGDNQSWTPESMPDHISEQAYGYPKNLNTTGFYATSWVPLQAGYIGVDAWGYFYDVLDNVRDPEVTEDIKEYGRLDTPEIDLSKDGGKLRVEADLYGTIAEDNSDKEHDYPKYKVNGIIALLNYDYNLGMYVEAESKHFDLSQSWQTCTAEFTKGSENSKVSIYATDGPGFIFIDNLKVKQNYRKGELYSRPIFMQPGTTDTYVDVLLPDDYSSHNYYQRIMAAGQREVYWATRTHTIFSRLSDPDPVYTSATSVDNVKSGATQVKAQAIGDDIVVSGVSGMEVTLCTADGSCIGRATAGADSVALHAPKHGVYVVKAGASTVKIAK